MEPNADPEKWESFLLKVGAAPGGDAASVASVVARGTSEELQQVLKRIELNARQGGAAMYRDVSWQLNNIYHESFRIPSLKDMQLLPVPLDKNSPEISSALKIEAAEDRLSVMLGAAAREVYLNELAQSKVRGTAGDNKGKFHPSPKRYLQREERVRLADGQVIHTDRIVQAAYNKLIERADDFRREHPGRLNADDFRKVVLTYPTTVPPSIRRRIEELVSGLGVSEIQMDYDEAVAAAMFYVWREFYGALDIGLEAFKARSRRHGTRYSQNVMVIDIGGGTTDLALIQLVLEEIDPFDAPDADRGAGGRYYKLTPTRRRSAGYLHLGGDLITLRVFLLLKLIIADHLLTLVSTDALRSEKLSGVLRQIPVAFRDAQDKFIQGSLVALAGAIEDTPGEAGEALGEALRVARLVLPTHGNDDDTRMQTFYMLWESAEQTTGGGHADDAPALRGLCEDFLTDGEARRHLGDFAFRGATAGELWGELHRALLRVPEPLARAWRRRRRRPARRSKRRTHRPCRSRTRNYSGPASRERFGGRV